MAPHLSHNIVRLQDLLAIGEFESGETGSGKLSLNAHRSTQPYIKLASVPSSRQDRLGVNMKRHCREY